MIPYTSQPNWEYRLKRRAGPPVAVLANGEPLWDYVNKELWMGDGAANTKVGPSPVGGGSGSAFLQRSSPNGAVVSHIPAANTDVARGNALKAALTASAAGDVIWLTDGGYDLGTTQVAVGGRTIVGTGRGCRVYGSNAATSVLVAADHCRLVNFVVDCTVDGTVLSLTGASKVVELSRMRLTTGVGALIAGTATLLTLSLWSCDLVSTNAGITALSGEAELYGCRVVCPGANDGVQCNAGQTLRVHGGYIEAGTAVHNLGGTTHLNGVHLKFTDLADVLTDTGGTTFITGGRGSGTLGRIESGGDVAATYTVARAEQGGTGTGSVFSTGSVVHVGSGGLGKYVEDGLYFNYDPATKRLRLGRADNTAVNVGELVLAKSTGGGAFRQFKIGLNSSFHLSFGDYGHQAGPSYTEAGFIRYDTGGWNLGPERSSPLANDGRLNVVGAGSAGSWINVAIDSATTPVALVGVADGLYSFFGSRTNHPVQMRVGNVEVAKFHSFGVSFPAGTGRDLTFDANHASNNFRMGATTSVDINSSAGTGAVFQLYSSTSASFPGHAYFDSGSHASAQLNFRSSSSGVPVTKLQIAPTYVSVIGVPLYTQGAGSQVQIGPQSGTVAYAIYNPNGATLRLYSSLTSADILRWDEGATYQVASTTGTGAQVRTKARLRSQWIDANDATRTAQASLSIDDHTGELVALNADSTGGGALRVGLGGVVGSAPLEVDSTQVTLRKKISQAVGLVSTFTPAVQSTVQWMNGVLHAGRRLLVTDTSSDPASLVDEIQVSAVQVWTVRKDGLGYLKGGIKLKDVSVLGQVWTASDALGNGGWAAVPAATDVASGIVELATPAEADTGTDTVRAVTPQGLAGRVLRSLYGAKGSLLAGTAASTPANLAVGANGTRLTADSAQAAGVRWDNDRVHFAATAAITTTVVTAASMTGFAIPVLTGETWHFRLTLNVGCSGVGGMKFAVTFPTGTMLANVTGTGATQAAWDGQQMTATATLTTKVFNNVAAQLGIVQIEGSFVATANGTVQFQFASVTAAQTSTIRVGSSMVAVKQ